MKEIQSTPTFSDPYPCDVIADHPVQTPMSGVSTHLSESTSYLQKCLPEVPPRSVPDPVVPKAIGSLAKKQNDVTRLGAQKLKFTPTLPARRKKE